MELIFSGFEQHFIREGIPFFPRIYSGEGALPEGFNSGLIRLDASEHSSLKWEVTQNYPLILWELDFGLEEEVVNDEARYLALELAVRHFSERIFPPFEAKTLGVALYRGPFVEALLDPLKLLASHLPEQVRPFLFLETDLLSDSATYFRKVNQVTLGALIPILKGNWPQKYPYAFPALGWEHSASPLGYVSASPQNLLPEKRLALGSLLPERGPFMIPEEPCRMIPEEILTHEWEGIDELLVVPSSISERCQRKLCGFEAAGGLVINSRDGGASTLPQETSHSSSLASSH